MVARRFPWVALVALWVVLSILLTAFSWQTALRLDFDDPDDFLRLQQIRDFLAGQSWFDLTQYRLGAPVGLPMHWSRLVDMPVLLFLVPLKPLIGQHLAEVVAVIAAPLLTLLALMVAIAMIVRRLIDPNTATVILACLLALSAPAVFLQVHPARIDHHGWQIVFAALAVAALLQRDPRRSGIGAGIALALYLNISIEGAPFVVATIGIVALLWAFDRESGLRLTGALWSLAAMTLLATLITAPGYRWHEQMCDAVMPSHIAALTIASITAAFAVRLGSARAAPMRIALLSGAAAVTLAVFGFMTPQCLGSPFGQMDPLVGSFWYDNVVEGMPVWRQDPIAGASMVAFPLVGLVGTILASWRAETPEMRRRWAIMVALALATLVTGTLVRRSAGVAHVVAVPGALFLIGLILRHASTRLTPLARFMASALVVFGLSPVMPIIAAAAVTPLPSPNGHHIQSTDCDRLCALQKIDLGPIVIATTPHSVYGSGYHRLVIPLRETILFFHQPPDHSEAFMRAHGFRHILVSPGSQETQLFLKRAPHGMMAHLIDGPLPDWLVEVPLGSADLRLYRLRD